MKPTKQQIEIAIHKREQFASKIRSAIARAIMCGENGRRVAKMQWSLDQFEGRTEILREFIKPAEPAEPKETVILGFSAPATITWNEEPDEEEEEQDGDEEEEGGIIIC